MKIRIPGHSFKKIEARRELVVILSNMISLAISVKKDIQHEPGG